MSFDCPVQSVKNVRSGEGVVGDRELIQAWITRGAIIVEKKDVLGEHQIHKPVAVLDARWAARTRTADVKISQDYVTFVA